MRVRRIWRNAQRAPHVVRTHPIRRMIPPSLPPYPISILHLLRETVEILTNADERSSTRSLLHSAKRGVLLSAAGFAAERLRSVTNVSRNGRRDKRKSTESIREIGF